MSSRERWILYPLLIFALALGLKSTLIPTTEITAGRIECADLVTTSIRSESVESDKMKANLVFNAHQIDAKRLKTSDLQSEKIVCSQLIASADDDEPQLLIFSTSTGGAIVAVDSQDKSLGGLTIPGGIKIPAGTPTGQPEQSEPPAEKDEPSEEEEQ